MHLVAHPPNKKSEILNFGRKTLGLRLHQRNKDPKIHKDPSSSFIKLHDLDVGSARFFTADAVTGP